jgi:hypothetical protein
MKQIIIDGKIYYEREKEEQTPYENLPIACKNCRDLFRKGVLVEPCFDDDPKLDPKCSRGL